MKRNSFSFCVGISVFACAILSAITLSGCKDNDVLNTSDPEYNNSSTIVEGSHDKTGDQSITGNSSEIENNSSSFQVGQDVIIDFANSEKNTPNTSNKPSSNNTVNSKPASIVSSKPQSGSTVTSKPQSSVSSNQSSNKEWTDDYPVPSYSHKN